MSRRLAFGLTGGIAAVSAIALVASLGPVPSASAQLSQSRPVAFSIEGGISSFPLAATDVDMKRVASYWSPERLKQASSYEPSTRPSPSASSTTSAGEFAKSPAFPAFPALGPTAGKDKSSAAGKTTKPAKTGKAKASSTPPMVGKVFFKLGDKEYWCSASVVHSPHRNLVATAGHCVFSLLEGKPVEDWIFIPSYDNGATSGGIFVGHTLYMNEDFGGRWIFDRDYAFVTVYRGFTWQPYSEGGQTKYRSVDVGRLEDKVGAFRFTSNQGTGRKVTVFGYPGGLNPNGSRPYTGQTVMSCSGVTEKKPVSAPIWQLDRGVRLPDCGFTSGASGGPWVMGYNPAKRTGFISGVTSLTWNLNGDGLLDAVSTPYFNLLTRRVYLRAAKQSTG